MMSVHLSAFLDCIKYLLDIGQNNSHEMVPILFFFPIKLFLQNKNLNKFCKCLLKAYILHTFKI